jgi:hypothetical protein
MTASDQEKIAIAREYFLRGDQGRPDVLELFPEDAEIYFPQFGFDLGRQSFVEMAKGFDGSLESIQNDYDRLTFLPLGRASGRRRNISRLDVRQVLGGGGKTPGGRFCNVFKFRDGRIASVHIYLDPDYTGDDEARFRWGKHRRW